MARDALARHTIHMTQTMSTAEILPIQTDDGDYLGEIELDLVADESVVTLKLTDEDGTRAGLALSIVEVEQLIAKLAVKVAQARMAA